MANFLLEEQEKYTLLQSQVEKLDSIVLPELKSLLMELNAKGVKNVILDLKKTVYCDSSGLSAMLFANRLCKNAEGSFVLCNVQEYVNRLILLAQLDSLFTIVPTVSEAVDFLFMEEVERELDENNFKDTF